MTDNLNIAYHTCRLVLKALNKFKYSYQAAEALQVSERTLMNYKKEFKIELRNGEYKAVNN